MARDTMPALDRRSILSGIAAGGIASLAGCSLLQPDDDGPATELDDDRARSLAEEFAPTIYFDRDEQ
ncbi:MAG: hypothetical protein ACOCPX_01245, partial [Halapricum sp.]